MQVTIGIENEKREAIASGLSNVLADSFQLYLKTLNFHWNVTGPHFTSLHLMFQEHYEELATAIDEIAERIRALGQWAPGSFAAYDELSVIKGQKDVPDAHDMVQELAENHQTLAKRAREVLDIAADASDDVTVDLLTQRMQIHEKTAWMLRSWLGSK